MKNAAGAPIAETDEAAEPREPPEAVLRESLDVGIARTDPSGKCLYVNDHWCRITGYRREQLLGTGLLELRQVVSEGEQKRVDGYLEELRHGRGVRALYHHVRPDGREVWVQSDSMAELDAEGRLEAVITTVLDVTAAERAKAEVRSAAEAVEAQLGELEAVYRATPVAMSVVGRDLRYLRANDDYLEAVGRSGGSIEGLTVHEVVHKSVRDRVAGLVHSVIDSGQPARNVELPGRSRQPPFEPIRWLVNVHPVFSGGRAYAVIGVMQNVTALKELEQTAQERLSELESLYRSAPTGLAFFDAEIRHVRVNAAYAAVSGLSLADHVGKRIPEVFPQLLRAEGYLRRILERGHRVLDVEVLMRPANDPGVEHTHLVSYEPLKAADGSSVGLVVSVHDVTERVRAEEEVKELVEERTEELARSYDRLRRSERLASLGTFAAGIAHQINNPVGGILLAAQFAHDSVNDPAAVGPALEDILRDAKRCGRIVRSVLAFARGDVGERTPVDLNLLVRNTREYLDDYARRGGGVLELVLDDALPSVLADASALDHVVTNLVENAVDAGARRVVLRTTSTEDAVRFCVEDDGCGIAEADREQLFDPFFTTRQADGGTGLGLSIAHGIVRAHGGSIDLDSEVGRGTRVTVKLPRPVPDDRAVRRQVPGS